MSNQKSYSNPSDGFSYKVLFQIILFLICIISPIVASVLYSVFIGLGVSIFCCGLWYFWGFQPHKIGSAWFDFLLFLEAVFLAILFVLRLFF